MRFVRRLIESIETGGERPFLIGDQSGSGFGARELEPLTSALQHGG